MLRIHNHYRYRITYINNYIAIKKNELKEYFKVAMDGKVIISVGISSWIYYLVIIQIDKHPIYVTYRLQYLTILRKRHTIL